MLSFQRLDVYQRAIEFLALAYDVVAELPRGNSERADQLTPAAESVVRNIAEGAGRWSEADSANRHKIARGEAMECAASLDVLRRNLVADVRYERGIRLREGVVAMLTKMVCAVPALGVHARSPSPSRSTSTTKTRSTSTSALAGKPQN
jgi:four helix bundle protein